jgi:hypothetical protein
MFRLLRLLISLAALAALIYFAVTVPLGRKTLWQHIKAIAGSKESQELVDDVKHKATSVIRKDGGARSDDKLTDQERRLLRKLIREKLEKAGSGSGS